MLIHGSYLFEISRKHLRFMITPRTTFAFFKIERLLKNSSLLKQPSRSVLRKRCSKNIQQIYRRTSMLKCEFSKYVLCNFIEITLPQGCSCVNLLHIFRTPFYKNTSGELLLSLMKEHVLSFCKCLKRVFFYCKYYYSHI